MGACDDAAEICGGSGSADIATEVEEQRRGSFERF